MIDYLCFLCLGAFAVYLEPWHADIFEFLELKINHGKVCLMCCKSCLCSKSNVAFYSAISL